MTTIHLDDKEKAFINEQVKAGNYESADAVVQAGLKLLRQRETKLSTLKTLVKEGLDDIEAGRVVSFENADEMTAYIVREATGAGN
jgi:antitoxin ParD1/3/4